MKQLFTFLMEKKYCFFFCKNVVIEKLDETLTTLKLLRNSREAGDSDFIDYLSLTGR